MTVIYKYILFLILILSHPYKNIAQGLQTKILQIAKIQYYLVQAEHGYQIVQKGLNVIQDLKQGDFNLHTDYFNSLKTVNPAIRNGAEVLAIIAMQAQIISDYKTRIKALQNAGKFTSSEFSYIQSVLSNILSLVSNDIDDLTKVISDGTFEMKDNERVSRINGLYDGVQDKYLFFYSFTADLQIQSLQKQHSLNDIQGLNKTILP